MRRPRRLPEPCRHARRHLHAYLDGETDRGTTLLVRFHLDDCADCDREARVHRIVRAAIADLRLAPDPLTRRRLERIARAVVADTATGA